MPSAEHLNLEEAIVAGFVALAVVLLHLLLPTEGRRLYTWVAAATAVVLVGVDFAPESVLVGVAGALLAGFIKPVVVAAPVSAGALAFVASRFPEGFSDRLVTMTVLLALIAGAAVVAVERLAGRRWLSVLLAISAGGVFACVPDTEQIAVVFPMLAVLGAGYALLGGRLDGVNQLLLAGATLAVLLVWAGGVGAVGRSAALAGVAACLGVLLALPVTWAVLTPLRRRFNPAIPIAALIVVQIALIYPASRVVGLEPDEETAAAGAALVLLAATCALALVGLVAALVRGPVTSEPASPSP